MSSQQIRHYVALEKTTTGQPNTTSQLNTGNVYSARESGLLQSVVIVLILLSGYLALAAFFYLFSRPNPHLKLSNSLISSAACLLFLQCCWFEAEITMVEYTTPFCNAYFVINVTVATIIRTIIYTVLWIRQRSIYKNPLQKLDSSKVDIISNVTIGGILVFAACQIGNLASVPQHAVQGGCKSGRLSDALRVFTSIVFTVSSLFQILLLGLTLYPVVKHIRRKIVNRRNNNFAEVAVRLSVCTAVCVVADIIFLVITLTKSKDAPVNFIPLCFAFNSVLNITSTLCSFVNCAERLWPFQKKIHSNNNSHFTGSQFREHSQAISGVAASTNPTKATERNTLVSTTFNSR